MGSMKCPTCNHRIPLPTRFDVCPNCGSLLDNPEVSTGIVTVSPTKQLSVLKPAEPMQSTSGFRSNSVLSLINSRTRPLTTPTQASWRKMRRLMIFAMPNPDLEGLVTIIQSQQEVVTSPGLAFNIIKGITDIFWSILNPSPDSGARQERAYITNLRVKANTGENYDVRIKGQLTGANLAINDNVALWGRLDDGVLIVEQAYNNTSRARIKTTADSSRSPVLTILLLLLAIVVALWALGMVSIPYIDKPWWQS